MRTVLSVVALVALSGTTAHGADPTAESRWNAVAACGSNLDERQRHACVDDVLRRAGVLTAEQEQRDQRQRFGLNATSPRPGAVTPPGAPDPDAATEPPVADKVEVKIAAVAESRDGKLVLTTEDGSVWRQIDSGLIRRTPEPGQTLSISKAALGSFLCSLGGKAAFHCRRSR